MAPYLFEAWVGMGELARAVAEKNEQVSAIANQKPGGKENAKNETKTAGHLGAPVAHGGKKGAEGVNKHHSPLAHKVGRDHATSGDDAKSGVGGKLNEDTLKAVVFGLRDGAIQNALLKYDVNAHLGLFEPKFRNSPRWEVDTIESNAALVSGLGPYFAFRPDPKRNRVIGVSSSDASAQQKDLSVAATQDLSALEQLAKKFPNSRDAIIFDADALQFDDPTNTAQSGFSLFTKLLFSPSPLLRAPQNVADLLRRGRSTVVVIRVNVGPNSPLRIMC